VNASPAPSELAAVSSQLSASPAPLEVRPNPVVESLAPYSPGRLDHPVDLRLDRNEGPLPPPAVRDVLPALDQGSLRSYHGTGGVEARLADRLGFPPEAVVVGAGADDLLERAIRAVSCPGRRVVLTRPSFEMLPRFARLAGAEVVEVGWWRGEYPVADVRSAASAADTAAVAVVSPNNPTGAVATAAAVSELARALPRALVLLDHAYVEFAGPGLDLTGLARELPNLLAFRTLSKAWGCAGLRVGYALGDPRVVGWLRAVGHPYPVAAPSLAAARSLLEREGEPLPGFLEEVRVEREALSRRLAMLGAEPLPSEANFVLARFGNAAAVRDGLARRGIAVRGFAAGSELESWLRLTLPGDPVPFARLVRALGEVLP